MGALSERLAFTNRYRTGQRMRRSSLRRITSSVRRPGRPVNYRHRASVSVTADSVKPSVSNCDGPGPVVLHIAGSAAGDVVTVQPADDVERHVNTGGDPCRGDDLAFVDDTDIFENFCPWELCAQPFDGRPVRRGA
jgi:hypothetical protein